MCVKNDIFTYVAQNTRNTCTQHRSVECRLNLQLTYSRLVIKGGNFWVAKQGFGGSIRGSGKIEVLYDTINLE